LQTVTRGKDVALYSRHGREFTQRFPVIAEAIAKLPCRSATMDGELVLAAEGRTRHAMHRSATIQTRCKRSSPVHARRACSGHAVNPRNREVMPPRLSDLSTLDLLHRASQIAENAFERRIGSRLGLTARQYAVLRAIATKEGLSQTAIVEATGIDGSTVAEMIPRMRERGWLQRRRARDDARTYAVRLTPSGKQALTAADPASRESEEAVLSALRTMRRDQFRAALIELIEAADRAEAGASSANRLPKKR
jgi:DNA-binding MarR family transcriptional regulator